MRIETIRDELAKTQMVAVNAVIARDKARRDCNEVVKYAQTLQESLYLMAKQVKWTELRGPTYDPAHFVIRADMMFHIETLYSGGMQLVEMGLAKLRKDFRDKLDEHKIIGRQHRLAERMNEDADADSWLNMMSYIAANDPMTAAVPEFPSREDMMRHIYAQYRPTTPRVL